MKFSKFPGYSLLLCLLLSVFVIPQTVFANSINTDSLNRVYASANSDSLKVEAGIELVKALAITNPDSAIIIVEECNNLLEKVSDVQLQSLLLAESQIFLGIYDFARTLELNFEIIAQAEKDTAGLIKDPVRLENYFEALNNIGLTYFRSTKLEDAKQMYLEMLHILDSVNNRVIYDFFSELQFKLNLNLGAVYMQLLDFDNAEIYTNRAYDLVEINKPHGMSTVLNNLGIIAKERAKYDLAREYHFRALEIREKNNLIEGQAQSYNNIAGSYVMEENYSEALKYAKKAYDISTQNGFHRSTLISLFFKARCNKLLKNYEVALKNHEELMALNDSILNREKINYVTRLQVQERLNKKLYQAELREQQLITEKERQQSYYTLILSLSLIGLALLMVVYTLQRNKTRNEKLRAEENRLRRKAVELEKQGLKTELEYKDKELATKVMYLAQTNELISKVSERLLKSKLTMNKENQAVINEIISDLRSHSKSDIWQEFEMRFQQVHTDFYTRLNDKFPNLSSNEKKLCAFLKLNMTSKEISSITYQSVNSIIVARSRLRKKLGLQTDENLVSFLEGI